jgi:hypothetical protein
MVNTKEYLQYSDTFNAFLGRNWPEMSREKVAPGIFHHSQDTYMLDGIETPRRHPDNFNTRLGRLTALHHQPAQQEEYRAMLKAHEEGRRAKLPDDLELAEWEPEDHEDLLNAYQQTLQGESL